MERIDDESRSEMDFFSKQDRVDPISQRVGATYYYISLLTFLERTPHNLSKNQEKEIKLRRKTENCCA